MQQEEAKAEVDAAAAGQTTILAALRRIETLSDMTRYIRDTSDRALSYTSAFQIAQMMYAAQQRAQNNKALADARRRNAERLRAKDEEAARLLATGKYRVVGIGSSVAGSVAGSAASAGYADDDTGSKDAARVARARRRSLSKIEQRRAMQQIKLEEKAALAELRRQAEADDDADADEDGDGGRKKKKTPRGVVAQTVAQLQEIRAELARLGERLDMAPKVAPLAAATAAVARPAAAAAELSTSAAEIVDSLASSREKSAPAAAANLLLQLYSGGVASIVAEVTSMMNMHARDRVRRKFLRRLLRAVEKRAAIWAATHQTTPMPQTQPQTPSQQRQPQPPPRPKVTFAVPETNETLPPSMASTSQLRPVSETKAHAADEALDSETKAAAAEDDDADEAAAREYTLPVITANRCAAASAREKDAQKEYAQEVLSKILDALKKMSASGVSVTDTIIGKTLTTFTLTIEDYKVMNTLKRKSDELKFNTQLQSLRSWERDGKLELSVASQPRGSVTFCETVQSASFNATTATADKLPIVMGMNRRDEVVVENIVDMPHMLVAGTTNSGKTTFLKAVLLSLMLKCTPSELRIVIIDNKAVDFAGFKNAPHLYFDILKPETSGDGSRVLVSALQELLNEMHHRNKLFGDKGVANLSEYNQQGDVVKLPFILIVFDEFESARASYSKKALEPFDIKMAELSRKGRSAGIHFIIATQRPTRNSIPGDLKSNLATRVCFKVADQYTSQVVLNDQRAANLLGNGDMLLKSTARSELQRLQAPLVTTEDVRTIVSHCSAQGAGFKRKQIPEQSAEVVGVKVSASVKKTLFRPKGNMGDEETLGAMDADGFESAKSFSEARQKYAAMVSIDRKLKDLAKQIGDKAISTEQRAMAILEMHRTIEEQKLSSYGTLLRTLSELTPEKSPQFITILQERDQRAKDDLKRELQRKSRSSSKYPRCSASLTQIEKELDARSDPPSSPVVVMVLRGLLGTCDASDLNALLDAPPVKLSNRLAEMIEKMAKLRDA